jgi:dihydroorotate dehydrogenase
MQATELLRPLVDDVRRELTAAGLAVPILIKIGPDLTNAQLEAVAKLALELGVDGIVAVNTTVDRGVLPGIAKPVAAFEGGGVSGPPLRKRSIEVLRHIRETVGDALVLVSVGGVESADDAWQRILAGASLVQVHTAFIFEGPAFAKRVNRELAQKVRDAGQSSIQDLIGAGCADVAPRHARVEGEVVQPPDVGEVGAPRNGGSAMRASHTR